MKRRWERCLLWEHPLFRRRFRGAPRSVSALTLLTALGLLCGGVILARSVYYQTAATPPVARVRVPPGAMGPGLMAPRSPYYYPGLRSRSMPRVELLEPLPAELMGRQFVRDLGMVIAVLLFLIAPGATAPTYVRQKKQKTFDLLLLTPLRPVSIVLGDWLGYAFPLCSVCLVALPFFVLSIAYGGVSLFEVGSVFALLFALTFALASGGLFCAAVNRSSGIAVADAYLFSLPLALLTLLGIELLITGPGNFLGVQSYFVSTETAVLLCAVLVSALVALNSLWWAIADFEYLYYQAKGEPVPGQREQYLAEGF